MNIYIFSEKTNYGEFVRVVVAKNAHSAYNVTSERCKSLKELGWSNVVEAVISTNETVERIAFDGGGDL